MKEQTLKLTNCPDVLMLMKIEMKMGLMKWKNST